jgi:hypothetical protein
VLTVARPFVLPWVGVVVADTNASRHANTVAQIRAVIQGQAPGALVEEVDDPLMSALTKGRNVRWQEYTLALPSHYPIRFLDDIEGSDLLGPLVRMLAPSGTVRTELQLSSTHAGAPTGASRSASYNCWSRRCVSQTSRSGVPARRCG